MILLRLLIGPVAASWAANSNYDYVQANSLEANQSHRVWTLVELTPVKLLGGGWEDSAQHQVFDEEDAENG